jgi:pilus assembly protein CpaC
VAEVAKSAVDALGVNLAFTDGIAAGFSNIGGVNPFSTIAGGAIGDLVPPNPSVTLFGAGRVGNTDLRAFVSALRENNLMRILAQPNLVAISGQEASFLAGGEFPIPVPQGGSGNTTTITIEFREFGVRLKFVPIVLGDGRIRLKLSPEVSDLDFTTAVRFGGFVVPGLTQRKVSTTVELIDGQSLAIAGLLNQNVTANKSVVPLLGDLPVLGPLFRSVRYQRKETELVVLVTPRVVGAMNPGEVGALPGENWRHPTEWDLFLNQDIGSPEGGPQGAGRAAGPTTGPATADAAQRTAPRRYVGTWGFGAAGKQAGSLP